VPLAAACSNGSSLDAHLTKPGAVQEGGDIPTGGPATGQTLPTTSFARLDGSGSATFADYAGKPMVVNVWGSWCPPCRQEMPALQQVSEEVKDQVTFVGIDSRDDRAAAQQFAQQTGVTYDQLYDPKASLVGDTGIVTFPTTFFVDAKGKVVAVKAGALDAASLKSKLHELFDA
jgi:thiol-disulfide isomerase/thioredoxin